MRAHEAAVQAAGAKVVYVSTGAPEDAAAFRSEHGLDSEVLSDVSRAAFAAAGLRRGWGTLLRLRAVTNAARALRAGHRQRVVQGDPLQQGGAFVFARDGRVLAEVCDVGAGDLLDIQAVLDALA